MAVEIVTERRSGDSRLSCLTCGTVHRVRATVEFREQLDDAGRFVSAHRHLRASSRSGAPRRELVKPR